MTLETPLAEEQAPAVATTVEKAATAKAATTMEASVAAAASASATAACDLLVEEAPSLPAAAPAPPEPLLPAGKEEGEEEKAAAAAAATAAASAAAVARRWASLFSSAGAEAQAAFLLKQVRACPRCCLRFAGIRDARAYAPPAPSSAMLLAVLIGGEGEEEGKESSPPAPPPPPPTPPPPPCSICLGVLQSPDPAFSLPLPTEKMATAAASMDMGAGTWVACERGTGESVAAVVEREGHYSSSSGPPSAPSSTSTSSSASRVVSLQVSFPASVGLRQASASAALAAAGLPAAKPSVSGGSLGPESITDVKDAVKAAVSPSLSKALGGMRVTSANDDSAFLTVSMQFVHPATAKEVELVPSLAGGKRSRQGGKGSVFLPTGGSDSKGCWKKRKRVPAADCAALGRAASQALVSGCARLDARALARSGFAVPPPPAPSMPHLLVRARASPLFVGGRYLKLLRDVSQSPFFDEKGDRRGRTSVQEEIERVVLPLFSEPALPGGGGCDGCKFVTAGREDLDVRCLGKGRPFILEIANAKLGGGGPPTQGALDAARRRLRESACGVELGALAMVGKEELAAIKKGETSKQKSYEALCWLPCEEVDDEVIASINGAVQRAEEEEEEEEGKKGKEENGGKEEAAKGKGLVLKQTTPARVEHRRAMLVRERAIHQMTAARVPGEPNQILLRLRTQAGLYVKEFVHGDGGRTVPSLVDVAGLRGRATRKKELKENEKTSAPAAPAAPAAAAGDDDTSAPSAAEEVEAAKCLSLDVCEIHLDFL